MSDRAPFAAVVCLKDRLSVVGSSELLSQILPKHALTAIAPDSPGWCHQFSESESVRWNMGDDAAYSFRLYLAHLRRWADRAD